MKLLTFSWLIATVFAVQALNAQVLTGRLADAKTKQALPFANLLLTGSTGPAQNRSAKSDTAGQFRFTDIPPGNYKLTASLIGYQKLEKEFTVDSTLNLINLGEILLSEDTKLLNTVTITGNAPTYSTSGGQLKAAVSGNPYFKSASNMVDVLKKIPGLQVNPDGTLLLSSGPAPTVFVDGKPVNMDADEVLNYLSSLTPDLVQSIELIAQPSSRYDGQYQGILDIKLKRSLNPGLKGSYNLRYLQNSNSLLDNTLAINYKTAKFSYGLNANHTGGNNYYRFRALQYLNSGNAMSTDTKTITANNNYNIQTRLAYEHKPGHSLETYFRTYQIDRKAETGNRLTTLNSTLTNILAIQQSTNNSIPQQQNYAGGINYDAKFKRSELHILTALLKLNNFQNEDIQTSDVQTGSLTSYWKTNSGNAIQIRSAQADYIQETGKAKLELGGKYAYTSTVNNLRYDTLSNMGFEPDPNRSSQFSYGEHIVAGYISYLGSSGKLNYSLGLRAEHTLTLATALSANTANQRSYLKWLPSASISYDIGKNQQLSLNFSKRLTRPTFAALNPFRFYYSPRHYWIGNPDLQPSTTNMLALVYSHRALNISLNAGRENNPMVRYPQYDPQTNILVFMGDNLPYRDFINLSANLPLTITKWWRTSNNIGLFYNRELRPYFGQTFRIPVYHYTFSGSQVFTLKPVLIDLGYSYESKNGNSLYIYGSVFTLDLALQRSWTQGRIGTKLAIQDIFNGNMQKVVFREKSIMDNRFYHDNGTRRLVFNLTYNFGRASYSQKENKTSEEEIRARR